MSTKIRASISNSNDYYISKHRYYELKHFCLQYGEWKQEIYFIENATLFDDDPTGTKATKALTYINRVRMVEEAARHASEELYLYLIKSVTEERSYTYLKTVMDIPCCKDYFYKQYRKFYWILDKLRE